jgi:ubiquinone/menaquinone biosynthesis C-methylase UbiE
MKNIDKKVVKDFGIEWNKYKQSELPEKELKIAWNQYFDIFPFDELPDNSTGFDMGCGSGRWAKFVANRVGILNCIDPSSKALNVAKTNLSEFLNINFLNASVGDDVLEDRSQDFGYCLGVLHHIPDTLEGIRSCSKLLKKNAPFLVYLYYNFENRSSFYKFIWRLTDFIRRLTSILPSRIKLFIASVIAILVYLPIARLSLVLEKIGVNVDSMPLSDYRNKPFYFMRTDALDRFGTRLEKRFSRDEITKMLTEAGFKDIKFSNHMPYWVCLARKA